MKQASRQARNAVLQVLGAVVRRDELAAAALDRALLPHHTGAQRSFITDVVYGTLRHLSLVDAMLAPLLKHPLRLPAEALDALRAGTYELAVRQTARAIVVDAWVDVLAHRRGPERALAGVVNAVLRKVGSVNSSLLQAHHYALPEPLWDHFTDSLGVEAASRAAAAMLVAPPLWLTLLHGRAHGMLLDEGADVREGPLAGTVSVRLPGPLSRSPAFQAGAVQPQNPSSAAVVDALGFTAGDAVLDVGSGHGVKAAQLAARGAKVTAVEVDPARAREGERNLARMGLSAQHLIADATQPLTDAPAVSFALLDAPCTGTGTLRRHPEIKLRWRQADAADAAVKQRCMLEQVAERVLPGGVLVYAVCALGREEGPQVVEAFLRNHPSWRAEALSLPLDLFPAEVGAWILPTRDGLDGFYLAKLRHGN